MILSLCLQHLHYSTGLSITSESKSTTTLTTKTLTTSSTFESSVTTFAGQPNSGNVNGFGTNAKFSRPEGIEISSDGTFALVAEYYNNFIRKIVITTAEVTVLAGGYGSANGLGTNAKFYYPVDVSISSDDQFALVADSNNHLIRMINISNGMISTLAGKTGVYGSSNSIGTNAQFDYPVGVAFSPDDQYALITDSWNNMVRKIIISTSEVSYFVGSRTIGSGNGIGTNAQFNKPEDVTFTPDGFYALVSDNNHLIRNITIATTSVVTFAGQPTYGDSDGYGTNAMFYGPKGISISPDGEYALVADTFSFMIRKIVMTTAEVTQFVGGNYGTANGIGTNARFYYPEGVAISSDGLYALVADTSNNLIRHLTLVDPPTVSPTVAPTLLPTDTPSLSPTISISPTSAPTSPSAIPTFHVNKQTSPSAGESILSNPAVISGIAGGGFVFLLLLSLLTYYYCNLPSRGLLMEDDVDSDPLTNIKSISLTPSGS